MEKLKIVVDLELYGISKYLLEKYPDSLIKQDLFDCFTLQHEDGSFVDKFDDWSESDITYLNECMADKCNDVFSDHILGICGCGNSKDTYKALRDVLKAQDDFREDLITYEEKEKRFNELGTWGIVQFVLYILDKYELLSHGSSIGGAFLTELGKKYLYVLNRLKL